MSAIKYSIRIDKKVTSVNIPTAVIAMYALRDNIQRDYHETFASYVTAAAKSARTPADILNILLQDLIDFDSDTQKKVEEEEACRISVKSS